MESLFKFIMIRPPEALDSSKDSVPLGASPATLSAINAALAATNDSAGALRAASQQILASPNAIVDVQSNTLLQKAATLAAAITATTSVAQARTLVASTMGTPPDKIVSDPNFGPLSLHASDTLVALKYLGATDTRTEDLAAAYRALAYIKLLAANADDTAIPAPAGFFSRTLTIAGAVRPIRPQPIPVEGTGGSDVTPDPREPLKARASALQAAITDLTAISPQALTIATPAAPTSTTPPARPPTSVAGPATNAVAGVVRAAILSTGVPATLVGPNAALRLVASPDAIQALKPTTVAAMQKENITLEKHAVPEAVRLLSRSLLDVSQQLTALNAAATPQVRVLKFGSGLYEVSPIALGINKFPSWLFSLVPTTHGDLKPVGIGDLLVVKQSLKRYEGHDLSDVVNVMKGEHRSTETKRTQSETTTTSLETTTTQEEERDQQTTERFEMQTETSNVQKSDESLKLGASVSASYGPFVTFKASADYELNNSKEQSSKVATNYSKEVTNKASSKITQSVKQFQSTVTVQTYLEDNVHEWDNRTGTDHIVGQYQWLDKIYEAQVYNYGKRLLFDTTVPEPAAFLYFSQTTQPPAGSDLVKPTPFNLTPDDITEWNFGYYVQQYGAAGVQAPPAPYTTVTKTFDGADDRQDRGEVTKTGELPIPDGYQAVAASTYCTFSSWDDGQVAVDISLGTAFNRWTHATGIGFWNTGMNNETNSVEFTLRTFRAAVFTASVEISCSRTDRALEAWKLATHEAIKQAFDKQMRDYEDALANAQNQAASQAHGSNPDANAQAIRDEIKRLMITLLTNQYFDMFGAVSTGPFGYPQIDIPVAEAQGAYVRFFEEAFEWQEMMYIFYPYFWARKSSWIKRVLFTDTDPQFQAFLKAGAARVVVSVRPGFELAVAHFMETGQIWDGGDPPTISDPTYLSIIDEIKAQEGAPQGEVEQGVPWDVRVPTNLVKLRLPDTLPEWKKDSTGTWVPAN